MIFQVASDRLSRVPAAHNPDPSPHVAQITEPARQIPIITQEASQGEGQTQAPRVHERGREEQCI